MSLCILKIFKYTPWGRRNMGKLGIWCRDQ